MAFASRFPVRKATIVLAFALLAAPISSVLAETKTYWFEDYRRAVHLIDAGRSNEALPVLQKLAAQQPLPANAVRVPGNRFLDYLPHFQIARAQAQLGNTREAEKSLTTSESYGVITESRRHLQELTALKNAIDTPSNGTYLTTDGRD